MMKRYLSAMLLSSLCACSNLAFKFENRVVCAVGKDQAYVLSEYGPVGLSASIAKIDKDAICASGNVALPAAPQVDATVPTANERRFTPVFPVLPK